MEELDKHSRLLWWSVENFMSIKEAKVEFDDTNIINFKGFNDSGKSAMLRALEVLLSNKYPTEQAKFIKDGESYFTRENGNIFCFQKKDWNQRKQ